TNYNWTVPADASISSGQGTKDVVVVWGATAGDISVVAANSCGTSAPVAKTLTIETIPTAVASVSGPDTVCSNHGNYSYSVPVVPEATTYEWTLPTGATITSGAGTNDVVIAFAENAVSGNITVAGHNTCGNGPSATKPVSVKQCTGINDLNNSGVTIYPNPTSGAVTVVLKGMQNQVEFQVISINGQILQKADWNLASGEATRHVDLSGFAKGVYYLKFISNDKVLVNKIIVQ
ncbi:MAG: T9SS type A sorting domain-containing protein, partial [Syntrophothermus sp.]